MKRILIFLIILLAISYEGKSASDNLALNKPAYANASALDWAGPASYANDGNKATRWQSTKVEGALISPSHYTQVSWWMVNLQSVQNIEGIQIFWEAAYASEYSIKVSSDSINWTQIFAEPNGNGELDRITFSATDAQFVKVETTVGNMQWSPSIYEVEVYGVGKMPYLEGYNENFNSGIPVAISYIQSGASAAYTISADSINVADYALKIVGPTINTSGANNDPIEVNFDINGKANFSQKPHIYFKYKADSSFSFKIIAVKNTSVKIETDTKTIYANSGWIEYYDSIKLSPDDLDTLVAIQLQFNSSAPISEQRSLFIDDLAFGNACPDFSLKIVSPIAGNRFKSGDDVKVFTNAPENKKVKLFLNSVLISELTSYPYLYDITGLKDDMYDLTAEVYDAGGKKLYSAQSSFIVGDGVVSYRNKETEYFANSLRALTRSDFMMFGMANALTISYSGGPQHAFNDISDCKDITGSHPAFIESDFMWYSNTNFKKNDTIAMREAYKRGAITGYCYHLGGRYSGDFYAYKNNVLTADKALVSEILASTDRTTNASLEWYLSKLDKEVIPVFKGLGFPIIYRPFHEMTGSWFWWGTATCTKTQFIQIYRLTVDYLRSHGVRNVLYAWAPDKSTDFAFYPGDDYVDIIGYDGYDVGIASYHSTSLFTKNVGTLSDYAATHDKIMAITETGNGALPAKHPDYWSKHILEPLKNTAKTRHIAWVMTWYNADWNHDGTGTRYIPYTGIENITSGQDAIDDFKAFYDDPSTIFLNDIPSFYANGDSSAFIYPQVMNLVEGDSIKLLGGMKCNWINDNVSWESSNNEIAKVSSAGIVTAIKAGLVQITVIASNGKTTICTLTVVAKPVSVNKVNSSSNISIYPNPANRLRSVCVDFGSDMSKKTIELITVQGQKIFSMGCTDNKQFIETEKLHSGIFLIKVSSKNYNETSTLLIQ